MNVLTNLASAKEQILLFKVTTELSHAESIGKVNTSMQRGCTELFTGINPVGPMDNMGKPETRGGIA